MNRPDRSVPSQSARSVTAREFLAPAPGGLPGERTIREPTDSESWLGYESIHPLTWVPESPSVKSGQGIE